MNDQTKKQLMKALEAITPLERFALFIELNMRIRRKTYTAIAKNHRLSIYYVSGTTRGVFPPSKRVIDAFEKELGVDLSAFVADILILGGKK